MQSSTVLPGRMSKATRISRDRSAYASSTRILPSPQAVDLMGTLPECTHHGFRDLLEQRCQPARKNPIRYLEPQFESYLAASFRHRIERPATVETGERTIDQLDVDSFRVRHPVAGRERLPEWSAGNHEARGDFRRGPRVYRRGVAPGKKTRITLDVGDESEHVPRRERDVARTGYPRHCRCRTRIVSIPAAQMRHAGALQCVHHTHGPLRAISTVTLGGW